MSSLHKTTNMTVGSPGKLIFSVAVPLMLGSIFQNLYTVADTMIVGQFVGLNALAAVGNTGNITWGILAVFMGICQGGLTMMSQKFGEGDEDGLRDAFLTLAITALTVILLVTICGLTLSGWIVRMLNLSGEIHDMALIYLQITFAGTFTVGIYNVLEAALRSVGQTKLPFIAVSIASVCNIALDLFFILVLRWGVAGAALATVIGQFVSVCICFFGVLKTPVFRLSKKFSFPSSRNFRRILRLSLPLVSQYLLISLSGIIVQRYVNRYSVSMIAGYSTVHRLYGVLEIAGIALGSSFAVYVGQNWGARTYSRIHRGTLESIGIAAGIASFIGISIYLVRTPLVSLFIAEQEIASAETIAIAAHYLTIMCTYLLPLYLLHLFRAGLQGLGHGVEIMLAGAAELVARMSVVLILPNIMGQEGIFYAEIAAWFAGCLSLALFFLRQLRSIPR